MRHSTSTVSSVSTSIVSVCTTVPTTIKTTSTATATQSVTTCKNKRGLDARQTASLPSYVSQYSGPEVSSACSCLLASTTATDATTVTEYYDVTAVSSFSTTFFTTSTAPASTVYTTTTVYTTVTQYETQTETAEPSTTYTTTTVATGTTKTDKTTASPSDVYTTQKVTTSVYETTTVTGSSSIKTVTATAIKTVTVTASATIIYTTTYGSTKVTTTSTVYKPTTICGGTTTTTISTTITTPCTTLKTTTSTKPTTCPTKYPLQQPGFEVSGPWYASPSNPSGTTFKRSGPVSGISPHGGSEMLYAYFPSSCAASKSVTAYQDVKGFCPDTSYTLTCWLRRVSVLSQCTAKFSVDGTVISTGTQWSHDGWGTEWSLATGSWKSGKSSSGQFAIEISCPGSNFNQCRELFVDDCSLTAN